MRAITITKTPCGDAMSGGFGDGDGGDVVGGKAISGSRFNPADVRMALAPTENAAVSAFRCERATLGGAGKEPENRRKIALLSLAG